VTKKNDKVKKSKSKITPEVSPKDEEKNDKIGKKTKAAETS
jgi:hypothetical protein